MDGVESVRGIAMVSRLYFRKKRNIENLLLRYPGIYSIVSEVSRSVTYGISDGKFAVFTCDGVAYCPVDETAELAMQMKDPDMKREIIMIYEDFKDLQRREFLIG